MPGLVPGLPKEAPPALVAACRRLEQDNLRAEKTIPGRKVAVQQGAEPLHSGKCFSAKGTKGAWLVDLSPLRRARKGVVSYYQGTWSLLYVTPEGKRIAGGARGTIDALEGEWSNDFDVIGLHDFDADGVAEVMIAAESYTAIDGFHTEHTAWTFRDGSVVPFRPQLPQQGWLDVDADGRPDVLLPPLRGTRAYAVLHTLPDGSTHDDDDVVRASLARVCPAPPRGPLRVEREVLCALAWGATPAAVEQRIDDGRPRDTCRAVLFGLLRPVPVTPRLQGACPSEMRPPSDSEPGALAPPSCP